MVSPARSWINKSAVKQLSDLQTRYGNISSESAVTQAAIQAGQVLQGGMQSMIRSQPDLAGYQDVSEGIEAWAGDDNVYVGLHPGKKDLLPRAQQLEGQFPLVETSLDMERQIGETRRSFENTLAVMGGFVPGAKPEQQ
jgi:hypothetical protein